MFRTSEDQNEKTPARETKTVGVITGGYGSSACTLYGNGARVSSSKGQVTYTAPDGKKTVYEGSSYTATKVWRDDDHYDVVVKIHP